MQRLLLLGVNHATAPLTVRERLAFDAPRTRQAISALAGQYADSELVVLSTCNRVELYAARASHGHPRMEEMIDFVAAFHGVPVESFRDYIYQKTDRAVVEHLFTVAASLDSMIVGETQILGQVRQAYDLAREVGSAGAMLNPLFQRALAVGKQVMTQTALAEGRLSIASVAVDYARRIFDRFDDKTVLSIGAGKMSTLVLQNFSALRPRSLLVCNRDPVKAATLAQKFNGSPAAFENLADHLAAADIVVTGTGSAQPIITKSLFETVLKRRKYRPVFLIDIAVPRDVEAAVGDLRNVYLYNLDDLQQVVAATRGQRREEIDAAAKIVAGHVDQFSRWHRARELGPLIDQLYQRCHGMAQEELTRTLGKLPAISDAEREQLQDLARRIVNKVLHDPVQQLRSTDSPHAANAQYLHAMSMLFQLNDAATDSDSAAAPDDSNPSNPK